MRIDTKPAAVTAFRAQNQMSDLVALSSNSEVINTCVMVIDDDPSALRLVEKALQGRARVLQTLGAPERGAMDLDGVDLVILDYKMPGRDGLNVLSEIRDLYPELPVLFMTGFSEPSLAKRALQLGADRFITKPISPGFLQDAVDEFLGSTDLDDQKVAGLNSGIERFDPDAGRSFCAVGVNGQAFSGSVVRFSSQSAIVEISGEQVLKTGDRVAEVQFRFGRQKVSATEGVVGECVVLGTGALEVELLIYRQWNIVEVSNAEEARGGRLSKAATPQDSGPVTIDGSDLPAEFRLSVYDLAGLLRQVQQDALLFEKSLGSGDGGVARLEAESEFVSTANQRYQQAFWDVMMRFEAAAENLQRLGLTGVAKPFARKVLYPFMLCSPFISRVVERPIGVPGDFEMLGQILGSPVEGHTLYERIVSSYILKSGAANAYRYRVDLLLREIRRCVAECHQLGRPAKILSMASGVAYEIQEYIQHPPEEGDVDFTLVDFSDETLEEARRQYGRLGALPSSVLLEMQQSSVIDLANQSRGHVEGIAGQFVPDSDYDHVYCAGLFDYLSDRLIVKVISYLHSILRPGGTLVVSNFTEDNPIKGYMTIVMDWELIYRTKEEFEALVEKAVPGGAYEIELDHDGAEVYAIVKS